MKTEWLFFFFLFAGLKSTSVGIYRRSAAAFIFILLFMFPAFQSFGQKSSLTKCYFIDSRNGQDSNSGADINFPLRSLAILQDIAFKPGDTIRFKRGSVFQGCLNIKYSGSADNYITLTDYGDISLPAPSFTNQDFKQGNFGNCIRVKGSYVQVENLYFHNTAAFNPGSYVTDGGWPVWEMGAIYIDKSAQYCIVRNNEIEDCVAGIRSYGKHALIARNYIHDCTRVLKEWNWGPIGIWLGADYQEVSYNRVFNYRAEDPRIAWPHGKGGGADGGALEIDDARYDKSHILIHHNYTRDCQGFLEVTWSDVKSKPTYKGFRIHHNISDDYQQFIALWNGASCRIENNTIIRRKMNANDWGVFNITQDSGRNMICNNIIITEHSIPVFNVGLNKAHHPDNIIANNLYYAASGRLVMGKEGPGNHAVFANPFLKNYTNPQTADDYSIKQLSPAINKGKWLNYRADFFNRKIPSGLVPDIGAFEFQSHGN